MKTEVVMVRMSKIEKKLIKSHADGFNMSVSEYVRFIAINGKIVEPPCK